MERLLKLSLRLICILLLNSCSSSYYEKIELSEEKRVLYSDQMVPSVGRYYQGTPQEVQLSKEAIALDPSNAHAWRELGIPYLKRGIGPGFYENYQKAVGLDSVGWLGWRGYIYLYFYRDYKRAIADFNALDPLTPNFVDHPQAQSIEFMRGIAYLRLGDQIRALEYLDKYIKEESEAVGLQYIDEKALLFKGISLYELEEYHKASETLSTGLEISFSGSEFLFWIAKCHFALDDRQMARDYLEKAELSLNKGNFIHRPYVTEFYQLHRRDIINLRDEMDDEG